MRNKTNMQILYWESLGKDDIIGGRFIIEPHKPKELWKELGITKIEGL